MRAGVTHVHILIIKPLIRNISGLRSLQICDRYVERSKNEITDGGQTDRQIRLYSSGSKPLFYCGIVNSDTKFCATLYNLARFEYSRKLM
jgi:hypothetical protein